MVSHDSVAFNMLLSHPEMPSPFLANSKVSFQVQFKHCSSSKVFLVGVMWVPFSILPFSWKSTRALTSLKDSCLLTCPSSPEVGSPLSIRTKLYCVLLT